MGKRSDGVDQQIIVAPTEQNTPMIVWVRVAVHHNGQFEGEIKQVPLIPQIQGFIDNGYLEIVPPPDGSLWA